MSEAHAPYDKKQLKHLLAFLNTEKNRSFQHKWLKGHPSIHYLAYIFRSNYSERLLSRLGAILDYQQQLQNSVYCDMRVGSYSYNNITDGGLKNNSNNADESSEYSTMPLEIQEDVYRFELWRLTDNCYREALNQYYRRKTQELNYVPTHPKLASQVRQATVRHFKYVPYETFDKDYWAYLLRKCSKVIKKFPEIKNSWFEFIAHQEQKILVNSQDAQILQQQQIYELRAHVWLMDKRGEGISQEINLLEGELACLPSEKEFERMIKYRIDLLLQSVRAPRLNSYSGPALLDSGPSSLFFHEVVGHRLEGSRLLSQEEGATFLDLYGKKITPENSDIIDDPSLPKYEGRPMLGHFLYDEEGCPAQRTLLVEKGILKNFLSTSAPLPRQKKNNGHARNQSFQRPISRMGNLIIVNHNPVSSKDMHHQFIEEIKRQKKTYGIHIKEVLGGETGTDAYNFQSFKGEILHAVRVFPMVERN